MPFNRSALVWGAATLVGIAMFAGDTGAQQVYTCAALRSPDEGGHRRWETVGAKVRLHAAPAAQAEVIAVLDGGAVLSNLGCVEDDGQAWGDVRDFRGGARGYVALSQLVPALGPDGGGVRGPDRSADRAKKHDFDAVGDVGCAQERGEALGVCRAGVARAGGGDATVVVTFANGFARTLLFVHGEFVAANATMSGVGKDVDWSLENGTHHLRVDDQRFELPDAFVFGP